MTWPQYRRRQCTLDGKAVALTPTEADIVAVLLMNRGKVVTKLDLFEAVWGDADIDMKIVDVYACRMRAKLPGVIEGVRQSRGVWDSGGLSIPADTEPFEPLRRTETTMAQRLAAVLVG
jgi:hypothetical protein